MSPTPGEKLANLRSRLSVPAICAPMFLVSGPELVAAACRAGVIGAFPFPNARTLETLETWLATLTEQITANPKAAPFAANLTTHRTYDRLEAEIALIAKYQPEVVITALGGPAPVLDTVHSYGGIVIADVSTIPLARKAVARGVDGLALVSAGAGGHTGSLNGLAFVTAVREFFDGIVVLAGGIGNGAGIRAAEVAGADLAYLGTRFIVADESLASDEYRDMVVAATPDDLVATDRISGALAYYLRASLEKMGVDPDNPGSGSGFDLSASQDKIKAWRDVWSAGHGVGSVTRREPAGAIVAQLEAEYAAAAERA
ncbi:MAG: nitronate monooxygenase [Pseudomonadota bacterium]